MSIIDVRVVLLPSLLRAEDIADRIVVVFDVLRATTTLTAALAVGVRKIILHPTLDAARAAYHAESGNKLLVGESACLKPADFNLGNSPGEFVPAHADNIVHFATTNGTKALLAPFAVAGSKPKAVLAGALVNRLAVAKACVALEAAAGGLTLLCAGTDGEVSYEDLLGCGAVLESLVNLHVLGKVNDAGLMAMGTWTWSAAGIVRAKPDQPAFPAGFKLGRGALNLQAAGFHQDIVFSARPDVFDVVGISTPLQL